MPSFIIKRLPVRFTYDNNYFNDKYQGIPIGGYTQIIEKMLASELIDIELNADFFTPKEEYIHKFPKVIDTGMIDQFFDYQFGVLKYRSLNFETTILDQENYQGNAVVNYTDAETPYRRIIEHKHFELFDTQPKTVITKEYPGNWHLGDEQYYPMNDSRINQLYVRYQKLAKKAPNVIFGGRLGMYKYYDMHQVIAAALAIVNKKFA